MMEERDFSIAIRIRPLLSGAGRSYVKSSSRNTIEVEAPRKSWKSDEDASLHSFNVHSVYDQDSETSQLYDELIKPLVPFALKGGFANVVAYGQTGSGKTYTMSECSNLIAESLFGAFYPGDDSVEVSLSCIELYGSTSTMEDLLDAKKTKLASNAIAEDVRGSVQFKASSVVVTNTRDFLKTLERAWSRRRTSKTFKNDQSSRSHCILRVQLKSKTDLNAQTGILQMLDLAGSERAASDSINHSQERLKETVFINKTLMTLKECIRQRSAAKANSSAFIPYRGSKLTLALKETFEITSRQPSHTVFIAAVSPCVEDVSATINTTRYAASLMVTPAKLVQQTVDKDDVTYWSHEQFIAWLTRVCGSSLKSPLLVAPYENGLSMSKVPEGEFIARIIDASEGKIGERRAKDIYLKFWDLMIKARTKKRVEDKKQWSMARKSKLKADSDEFTKLMLKELNV